MKLEEKRDGSQVESPAEKEASALEKEAAEAIAQDSKDEPRRVPENLTIVDYGGLIVEKSSDPAQFVTRERLVEMTTPEIRAIGHDRGYWRRGVSLATKAQLITAFLEKQGDPHPDDPTKHTGALAPPSAS